MDIDTFLAKLYTDADLRVWFLSTPEAAAREAGLDEADVAALGRIDRTGLIMAAKSYANKRAAHKRPKRKLHELLLGWLHTRGN